MSETSSWEWWERAVRDPASDPLEILQLIGMYQRYLSAVEKEAVTAARATGRTWEEIAGAIGTSRQAAWERLKGLDPEEASLRQALATESAAISRRIRQRLPASVAGKLTGVRPFPSRTHGPVSYVRVVKDDREVCALWAARDDRAVGVLDAPGGEADGERWRRILLRAADLPGFSPLEFVDFWAGRNIHAYEMSELGEAASLDELRHDLLPPS